MKKFLLAALLAALRRALGRRLAEPRPPRRPMPAYAPQAFSWMGFYIGVNGGYGFGSDGKDFGNPSGGLVGVTAGYNYQIGQLVLGVESDWDWADLTKSGLYSSRVDDLFTARARAGYAIDRALLYVTGGYAGAEDKISIAGFGSQSDWRNGGVIGGGLEYAFTNNISAKAEYLYEPLADKSFGTGTKSDLNLSLVRAGLNYKF